MTEEIINRVAQSKLVTIDLEAFYPEGNRMTLDISEWLLDGLLLREKEFRAKAKAHDWSQFKEAYVMLTCSTDAIIPGWAYMLVSTYLSPVARKVVIGNSEVLDSILYTEIVADMDITPYQNMPVIIKGCSKKPVPQQAFIQLVGRLQPVAKSIMYGEACSSVPLFKNTGK